MIITEIKDIHNHRLAYDILKAGKLKFECPILILYQNTGCWYTNPLIVDGNITGDLIDILDDIYHMHDIDNMPFRLYTYEDVIDNIGLDGYENYLTEEYYPINGGEYFTDSILDIEEL